MKTGKICNCCKIFKPYEEFSICNKHTDGRQYKCIACVRIYCKTKNPVNYTEIEGEIWLPVVGYEGYFSCSNLGRIKSEERVIIKSNGVQMTPQRKILIPTLNHKGYQSVCISRGGGNKVLLVHRLVAMSFLLNPENKKEVNHINAIKTDNRVENLEWCTPKENMAHAIKLGLTKKPSGKFHHRSKKVINSLTGELFYTVKSAAKSLNITRGCLEHKLKGRIKNNTNLVFA